jgi:hypothetical protein
VQDLKDYFGDRPAATSAVLTMLRRPEDEAHWYKAVVALGILAPSDEDLIASLLNFVASDSSFEICYSAATCSSATCLQELSFPAAKRPVAAGAAPAAISDGLAEAKIQAPIAIGDLLPRLAGWRSIEPVKILIAGTNPDYWPTRIRWASSPHFADDRERNVMIASQCVKALALSGQPIGQDRVRFLKANPSVQDAVFREAVDESSSLLTRRR